MKSVGVEEPLRANYGNYAENATTWGELHDSSLFGLHVDDDEVPMATGPDNKSVFYVLAY